MFSDQDFGRLKTGLSYTIEDRQTFDAVGRKNPIPPTLSAKVLVAVVRN
jgi:hypothetical protein